MAEQRRTIVRGEVVRVKGNGQAFALDRPDNWVNLSQWLDDGTTCPPMGAQVTVGLDSRGYARSILVDSAPAVVTGPSNQNLTQLGGEATQETLSQRDRLILRQVALKAAVDTHGPLLKGQTVGDVLAIAEVFASWLALHEPNDTRGES